MTHWTLSLTVCALPLFAQVDVDVLRAKYGPPVEEVLTFRPGVTLSIAYAGNRQVCKLELRATRNAPVIPAALVQTMIDEIAPVYLRGTAGRAFMSCTGANCWQMTEYQKLTIGQATGDVTPNPEIDRQNSFAVVQFPACEQPKP